MLELLQKFDGKMTGWTKAGDQVTTEAMTDPRDIFEVELNSRFYDIGCWE